MTRTEAITRLKNQIAKGLIGKDRISSVRKKIAIYESMTDAQYEARVAAFAAENFGARETVARMARELKGN